MDELARRLRFRHLQLLLELERGGSLRAAAEVLHLTQPALSKALNEIESAFGCALFTRNARGLLPTERGLSALRGARQLLHELGHVQREVALGESAAIVRIGAPPFVAQSYLPGVIVRLVSGNSPVHVELVEERVPALIRALADGEVDALLSSYPSQLPDDIGIPLRFEKLFDSSYAVIAPVKHALARASRLDWSQLADVPWIMPTRTSLVRRVVEEAFVLAGVSPPDPIVESTSPVTNVRLVAAGIGLTVVPEQVAGPAISGGLVSTVPVRPMLTPGPVALIHRGDARNPRVSLLRDVLKIAVKR